MGLIQCVKSVKYRMTLRLALMKASIEELQICKEELRKEFDRRTKTNGKKRIY